MCNPPDKFPDYPTFHDGVDRAVSAESLKAAASETTDPQVLLGLACLARAGSPVRKEIAELALRAKAEYAPIVPVLAVMLDGADELAVSELIQRDPDNALGYYLQGTQLYHGDKEAEALAAFRKGAHCSEMRFYEPITGEALFKALDALRLQGRERLCALSWMETRASNARATHYQPLHWALSELARSASTAVREEISELFLILAGQLFVTNFQNRWYSQHGLDLAFGLKAELAATQHPAKMHGYAAAVYAFHTSAFYWPGVDEEVRTEEPLKLAQHLPSRIHRSFAMVDPSKRSMIGELKLDPPARDRRAFEAALEKLLKAAEALLEAALTDPDGILGPYLKGIPPSRKSPASHWACWGTPVGGLMHKRPDVFKAAAAYETAQHAAWKAGENDPSHLNVRRLMEIGIGLHSYAAEHDHTFPENLEVLFERGYLKPPLEATSLRSGRPYIYPAAGLKRPKKQTEWLQFVLLYDADADEHGSHESIYASGAGGGIRSEDLQEQLRSRRTS